MGRSFKAVSKANSNALARRKRNKQQMFPGNEMITSMV